MNKKESLLNRAIKTTKGKQVIATLMHCPIKICGPSKIINGEIYQQISEDGKFYSQMELKKWKENKQKQHQINAMKTFNLTEDDLKLTEEKIIQWENEDELNSKC